MKSEIIALKFHCSRAENRLHEQLFRSREIICTPSESSSFCHNYNLCDFNDKYYKDVSSDDSLPTYITLISNPC